MGSSRFSRRETLRLVAGLPVALAAKASTGATDDPTGALYRNPAAAIPDRVEDLLGRMTPAEKVAQMIALWETKADIMEGLEFEPDKASQAYPDGFGHISRPSDKRGVPGVAAASGGAADRWRTPRQTVEFVNAVQRWATQHTRLGIPVLFHEESLHGYMATEATMFPQAIALAGSFDPDLVREVNSMIAREVRARGVPLVLSPVVDIARDPRWGRIEETFGEDPCLVSELSVAAVEGLQGTGKPPALAPDKVFATLKHMTGHGQPQAGNNVAPAAISERELRANFFPPFRNVVERTAIRFVMPSYNEIDGVPSHANQWLLGDVLRGEWDYGGMIVADYDGIQDLQTLHRVAADLGHAARLALDAGVDCDLPDGRAYRTLAEQIETGAVDMALIDAAVRRVLEAKFRAGLFENPLGDLGKAERITGNGEARDLAARAARRSICLLKNDGLLPLEPGAHSRVAVIGPNAAVARLGGYSSVPRQTVTLLDGVRTLLGGRAEVRFAQGVFITQSEDRSVDDVLLADPARNRALIAEAVAEARDADLVLLAIGDTEQTSREGFSARHLGDRTHLDLVGQQNELFDALHALGKPLVVCAFNGRPPSWPNVAAKARAILECWYPGQEGGTAVAEALFGVTNPGAKLPVTVVREVGQVPFFHNHKPSARRGYLFADATPLFPFGHGLSYTTFEIGSPRLAATRIAAGQAVEIQVDVHNTGQRRGDEVVQLYLRDQLASVTQPVQSLKAFRRVSLEPGERTTVSFRLEPRDFMIWNLDMQEVIEPGRFTVMAGPDSVNLKSVELEVV